MTKKFIDLSISIENNIKSDPPGYEPKIDYVTHQQTLGELTSFFPGLMPSDLPDGEGWSYERINFIFKIIIKTFNLLFLK